MTLVFVVAFGSFLLGLTILRRDYIWISLSILSNASDAWGICDRSVQNKITFAYS